MTSKDLIIEEVNKLIDNTKKSLDGVAKIALDEAWKLLQLVTASIVQIIESIGNDLSGPDKKELALSLIEKFYDKTFLIVDVPYIPNALEKYFHKYIKQFLMILIGSTIDSMVTIFRNTGVFLKKSIEV